MFGEMSGGKEDEPWSHEEICKLQHPQFIGLTDNGSCRLSGLAFPDPNNNG